MRLKINGNWRDISFIKLWDDALCGYISTETMIEDIEINGRRLALDNDVATKSEAVEQQGNNPTENVGKEDNFPTKGREFYPGDSVFVQYHNEPTLGTIMSCGYTYAEIKLDNTEITVFERLENLEQSSNVEVESEPEGIKIGDTVMFLKDGAIEQGKVCREEDGYCFMQKDGCTDLIPVLKCELILGGKDNPQSVIKILIKQSEYWINKAENYKQQAEDYKLKATDWYCHESHLTADAIDWEQRQFDIASKLYLQGKYMSQACLEYARAFVEAYKKEVKQ